MKEKIQSIIHNSLFSEGFTPSYNNPDNIGCEPNSEPLVDIEIMKTLEQDLLHFCNTIIIDERKRLIQEIADIRKSCIPKSGRIDLYDYNEAMGEYLTKQIKQLNILP